MDCRDGRNVAERAAGSTFGRHHRPRDQQPNARVATLQEHWDRLGAGLDLILDQRDADMADLPGGANGMLVRDDRGKEADRLVIRIDPCRFL